MVTTNPHQLLVRYRTGKESSYSYWFKAMSVIFNICNNEVNAKHSFVLCQCFNLTVYYAVTTNRVYGILKTKQLKPNLFIALLASYNTSICISYVFISLFLTLTHSRARTLVVGSNSRACAVLPMTTRCSSDSTSEPLKYKLVQR